jgi:hypothetical protein
VYAVEDDFGIARHDVERSRKSTGGCLRGASIRMGEVSLSRMRTAFALRSGVLRRGDGDHHHAGAGIDG